MSNPPKPIEVKRKLGNPGQRALPDKSETILIEPISDLPEPHRQLFDAGLELWNRTWSMGQLWISPKTDIELLLMTCEMLDERVRLRAYVWNNPEAWRERKALRELEKNITNSLSLLGFTPTDRSRLGVAEVKAKSKLEELRAKRDQRD
jgi:hypothetical protein